MQEPYKTNSTRGFYPGVRKQKSTSSYPHIWVIIQLNRTTAVACNAPIDLAG